MPKVKISEYSATANSNTDVASINIDEGCAPSGINNAIRAVMGHLKDFQSGTSNDPFTIGSSGSLTLSYGTANGVAYLNGSKVLTTGSALKFDGTALAIGSVTPSTWMLDVKSAGTGVVTNGIRFNRSNVTTQYGVLNYEGGQFNNVVVNTAGTGCFWGVLYSSDGSTTTQPLALDASGNFGVGTTSPTYKITVKGGNANNLLVDNDGSQYTQLLMQRNSTANTGGDLLVDGTNGLMSLRMLAVGSLRFCTSASAGDGTERARIDSSGNLLVGTTSTLGSVAGINVASSGANVQTLTTNSTSSSSYYIGRFYSGGTEKGYIYYNGSTVAFTSTSDYRLKEDVQPMTGALAKVAQLKPCTYTWKSNGVAGQGFIAHELEAIVPDCVTGEKDALNEDGSIKPQGIDTSFLVATLTAAIQEQQALITTLTARITALESA